MIPLEIPPGVVRTPTKASRSANWREVNLIRWDNGVMKPVAGWDKLHYATQPQSRVRQIHTWTDNHGVRRMAFLCEAHVYIELDGDLYDISPEDPLVPPYDDVSAGGYGQGPYNYGDYGTPRDDVPEIRLVTNIYTVDNWGQDLLIMSSVDGRLLRWTPPDPLDPIEPCKPVPNAPTGRTFVVTPERYVMMFGIDGVFNRFGWCNQEDVEDWNFATTLGTAGFYDIQPASPFVGAANAGDGVLFFTANGKAHISRYVGLPAVYSNEELSDATVPISAMSICNTAIGTIWPSRSGFWVYNGAGIIPVHCPVWDWIVSDFAEVYSRYEAYAVDIPSRSEMWWFFTSTSSRYNDRCVIYNYREGWWSQGRVGRSCGTASSFEEANIMADGLNVYRHEVADTYPDIEELPWAETFTLNLGSGSADMMVFQMLPDIEGDASGLRFRFAIRNRRAQIHNNDCEVYTPPLELRPNGYVDVRRSGRDFRLRIDSVGPVVPRWTFGQTLLDVRQRGKKTTVRA